MKILSMLRLIVDQGEFFYQLSDQRMKEFKSRKDDIVESEQFYFKYFIDSEKIYSTFFNKHIRKIEPVQLDLRLDFPREKFINLPKKFTDLQAKFLTNKCSFCLKYPRKRSKDLLLCMICGYVLCNKVCSDHQTDSESNSERIENLTIHAAYAHSGSCCYISLLKGTLYIVEFPVSKTSKLTV
jgi:hypothetical protein